MHILVKTELKTSEACGKVLLSYAAIFSLHVLAPTITPPTVIHATAEFEKVIHPKGRSTG
jgi:hypothetical protein